jgi:hypothetical protein
MNNRIKKRKEKRREEKRDVHKTKGKKDEIAAETDRWSSRSRLIEGCAPEPCFWSEHLEMVSMGASAYASALGARSNCPCYLLACLKVRH